MNKPLHTLPSIEGLKHHAKRLRTELAENDMAISHSRSLEMIAHQYGFKDWNTVYAKAKTISFGSRFYLGATIKGRYLGQAFQGKLIGLQKLKTSGKYRLTIHLETPIDIIKFESFSAFRHRLNANVDEHGMSWEKTSDGVPQMAISNVI